MFIYSRLFPAPGLRRYSNGTLFNAGDGGDSWSSSVSNDSAFNLYFYNSGINPQTSAYRVGGRPVRCLQE